MSQLDFANPPARISSTPLDFLSNTGGTLGPSSGWQVPATYSPYSAASQSQGAIYRPLPAASPGLSSGQVVFVFMAGANKMSEPQAERRPFPDHLYIPLHEVVMRISIVVFLMSFLSIITSLLTKFNLIHPLFAVLFAVGAIGFYLMARMFETMRRPS